MGLVIWQTEEPITLHKPLASPDPPRETEGDFCLFLFLAASSLTPTVRLTSHHLELQFSFLLFKTMLPNVPEQLWFMPSIFILLVCLRQGLCM